MVYPRALRIPVEPRDVDPAAHAAAFDVEKPIEARLLSLWELRGAPAWAPVGDRTLAERLGEILNDGDFVVASEAYEVLCTLSVPGGDAQRDLALGLSRRGRLAVARWSVERCAREGTGNPELDGRITPLVKATSLAPSCAVPVVVWPKTVGGHDLVLERVAHARGRALAVRVRGDEALVGSLRESSMHLPVPRRHLRFKRQGESWTVVDVYAEGLTSIGGSALRAAAPVVLAHGTRIDVAGEGIEPGTALVARLVPRLDRTVGVTVKFRDQGRRVERLAAGEALFLGPGADDDVATPVRVRVVALPTGGAVIVGSTALPTSGGFLKAGPVGLRFDGDDVVIEGAGPPRV